MSATSSTRAPSGARRQHDPARGAGAGVGARQGTIREHNLALLTQQLFGAGIPLSRAALAARTGMTRSTVSRLVDDLLAAGILREEEAVSHGGRGRPAVPLLPARRTLLGLGLEVNVDFLAARALDLSGEVVAEEVVHDDLRGSDPTQVLARTGDLARAVARRAGRTGGRVVASALALPGLVQRGSGRLLLAPNLGWTDVDPLAGLGDTDGLGDVVAVVNEADAGAIAAARPRRNGPQLPQTFLYVSAQVGIGAATVSRGVVEAGTHGWAGEIGHVAVVPDGPRCRCGATGCLEQYAGKEALAEAAGLPPTAEAEELLEVALRDGAAGEPARAALDRAAWALGVVLAGAVNLLDVGDIVLGGEYVPLAEQLRPGIEAELAARVLAAPWTTLAVHAAEHVVAASATGAALQALAEVVQHPARWVPERPVLA